MIKIAQKGPIQRAKINIPIWSLKHKQENYQPGLVSLIDGYLPDEDHIAHVEDLIQWHHIGIVSWQLNDMCVVEAGGKKLTLARRDGALFAFAYKCPHASGIMADGVLDGAGNVVCPVHRYRFSLASGRNTSGEGYYIKTYSVEERVDGIYVGWEEKGLFGWL